MDQQYDVHRDVVIQGHNLQKSLTAQGRSRQGQKNGDVMTKNQSFRDVLI
jgi:hypothetical protein